ncbi:MULTISPECIES: hypothetical protein [unclassified Colwellia]|uniref:hypothetical protein n=1 Tax=unclassified Colwellia TaxID=196834 RepID=UPI0015F6667F|nr:MULTISPECIES: hypothetical protein [unclassified Colwellia]MBA6258095.1 hypothetical protein [Colwellia sp. MB3u-28]MBA6259789.1 hypothetical protein [Colwellia sp. MB3u-41]
MSQLWQCILADFKQRTRQQSFVVTLLAMSVLTLLFFPSLDDQYQTLVVNGYRGIYNSAWLGICLAMLNVLFLPLICFYLVKNGLELDRQSMTSELIAATPINKLTFLFAKWCTNVLILVSIVMVMLISCILLQLYYGESYQIDLWALAWPQLVFVLPMLLAVASLAIMFETIKWLKNGLGNVVYFFLWTGSIIQSIESVSGIGAILSQLDTEVAERFPLQQGSTHIGVTIVNEVETVNTFIWQGIEPSISNLLGIIPLLIISLSCFIIAVIFFDRFSQHSLTENKQSSKLVNFLNTQVISRLDIPFYLLTKHYAFTRLLRLELKLLLKGHSTYWVMGLLTLNIIQLFISQQLLVNVFLPLSWLWCVLVVSQLGQIEKQANTTELITYSKKSAIQQSLASYSSAWVLLTMASLGSALRFAAMSEWLLIIQLIIAISFTVSLAYFCGAFTGTKRMFEVLYPAIWYMGPIQAALYLDFFGVNSQVSWQAETPYYFLAISIALLVLTVRNKSVR